MADAIRRSHARLPCDLPVEIYRGAAAGSRLGGGRLLNLSLSGAYLAFDGELQRGTPYRLSLAGPEGPVELAFRVIREGPIGGAKTSGARSYGLHFNLTADQERHLRKLHDALRRRPHTEPETRFDRTLKDYWSS